MKGMTEGEIAALAERILAPKLNPLGLERITVSIDRDDPDDPALFVEAFMRPGAASVEHSLTSKVHHDLSRSLLDLGEMRFPYFLVRYLGDEPALGLGPDDP